MRLSFGLTIRRLVAVFSFALLATVGTLAWAPSASAHYCVHFSHEHWHADHWDWYEFEQHYDSGGKHWHQWWNATHFYRMTVDCGPAGSHPLGGDPAAIDSPRPFVS